MSHANFKPWSNPGLSVFPARPSRAPPNMPTKLSLDPESEKGFYYRSDHFEFAKQGVPALYTDSGINYEGKDSAFSKQKRDEYTTKDYHKVSDEIKSDWDLTGAVDDAQLLTMIGYRVAQGDRYPEWKAGSEFKARRDEMMKGTASSGP